ncbi:hypothetical protein ACIOEX_11780 [Streptomyces sp. NPDC087850]
MPITLIGLAVAAAMAVYGCAAPARHGIRRRAPVSGCARAPR